MIVARTWRTRDGRWLVDRVTGEHGMDWRVWDEGELVAELVGNRDVLVWWLARHQVEVTDLHPVAHDEADVWCE